MKKKADEGFRGIVFCSIGGKKSKSDLVLLVVLVSESKGLIKLSMPALSKTYLLPKVSYLSHWSGLFQEFKTLPASTSSGNTHGARLQNFCQAELYSVYPLFKEQSYKENEDVKCHSYHNPRSLKSHLDTEELCCFLIICHGGLSEDHVSLSIQEKKGQIH